jgi:hypothetical protein
MGSVACEKAREHTTAPPRFIQTWPMPPAADPKGVGRSTGADDTSREAALTHLQPFSERLLPGTVRRIAAWKRLGSGALTHLVEDLRQELAVDCLEHATAIAAMTPRQRHGRWMRLCERWIYQHHVRARPVAEVGDDTPAPVRSEGGSAPPADLPGDWVRLSNGRSNLSASVRQSGQRLGRLQHQLERTAAMLGRDAEYDAFWRARLAEAMTGLAADLLLLRRVVHVLPRARQRPDPRGRVRRIRAIAQRFPVLPSTIDVRRAMRPWMRHSRFSEGTPLLLLTQAVAIWPFVGPAWLWLFEARLGTGDSRGAAEALRAFRERIGGERVAVTLARARLLEVRGRCRAAVALVERAVRRWPCEPRLREALGDS